VGAEPQLLGNDLVQVSILTCVTVSTQNSAVPALKEWAVVVHALLEGEQIIDVRKGGLREEGRHFDVPARRLWLYPTAEHQRAELLKPAYRHWIDLADAAPVGENITLHGWADIVDVATVSEPEHLEALDSKLIWTDDYASSRLKWKRRDPLWVLILRAYRLESPLTVSWNDEYGGCTSWVDLGGLPNDPAMLPSQPALSDVAFEAKHKGIRDALPADVFGR
jgi:hypothetical protein